MDRLYFRKESNRHTVVDSERHFEDGKKKTWILGEFEGRWATRLQVGEWGTDTWDGTRTGVSEWLPSQPHGNVGAVCMDTSVYRCRRDIL